jgi:hypothetical protein
MSRATPLFLAKSNRLAAFAAGLLLLGSVSAGSAQSTHEITVSGTRFLLNGEPFPYTGVSFFNAIYNPNFNRSQQDRLQWMQKFQRYGVNVLRFWGQWDSTRGGGSQPLANPWVDTCADCTLYYHPDGRLRQPHVERLKEIVRHADRVGMVIALALFSRESWNEGIRLDSAGYVHAATALARELMPYRNVTFQVWNENSEYVLPIVAAIREVDPRRLITNSPGYPGNLGNTRQNEALDFLTPHTSRRVDAHWEIAPHEIGLLIHKFRKPVVDDEPARTGTASHGGPRDANYPLDHILRMYNVWRVGGYVSYHHDMFQTGYGTPAIPPSGIPDPEFSDYHRAVFEFLAQRDRYRLQPGGPPSDGPSEES